MTFSHIYGTHHRTERGYPLGVINGLDVGTALIVSVLGNLAPVPFIIIFYKKYFQMDAEQERKTGQIGQKNLKRRLIRKRSGGQI